MEPLLVDRTRRWTLDEYFRMSETSEIKYEFCAGELIPFGGWERDNSGRIRGLAGTDARHSKIAVN